MEKENYPALMLILLLIGALFFFSPVWEENRILTTATGTPIGRITNMLSVPEQFTPGEEFTIRVVAWNDGEKGTLFCRLINRDTGEEIAYRTLYFPANKGATFIFTVVTDQTATFKVKAEVGHDNVVDDTETLDIQPNLPTPPSLSVTISSTQAVGIMSLLGALVLGIKYFSIL